MLRAAHLNCLNCLYEIEAVAAAGWDQYSLSLCCTPELSFLMGPQQPSKDLALPLPSVPSAFFDDFEGRLPSGPESGRGVAGPLTELRKHALPEPQKASHSSSTRKIRARRLRTSPAAAAAAAQRQAAAEHARALEVPDPRTCSCRAALLCPQAH